MGGIALVTKPHILFARRASVLDPCFVSCCYALLLGLVATREKKNVSRLGEY